MCAFMRFFKSYIVIIVGKPLAGAVIPFTQFTFPGVQLGQMPEHRLVNMVLIPVLEKKDHIL